jgi:hypothetical protein
MFGYYMNPLNRVPKPKHCVNQLYKQIGQRESVRIQTKIVRF